MSDLSYVLTSNFWLVAFVSLLTVLFYFAFFVTFYFILCVKSVYGVCFNYSVAMLWPHMNLCTFLDIVGRI